MAFWSRMLGRENFQGEIPNANPPSDVGAPGSGYTPGEADGVEILGNRSASLPLPWAQPSPWSGWPANWSTPNWSSGTTINMRQLVDAAWAAIDLNARVLSSFPVNRLRNGQILPSPPYLINPDPRIYASWAEFAKQLFWDFQLGEAFVMPFATNSVGLPIQFRVVPPWLMNVELRNGGREYHLGSLDVTDEILHIRNISTTADARGHGPLEAAGARMVTAGLLQRYADKIAETGGTPMYWLEVARTLTKEEADDMLDVWVESRKRHAGEPAIASGNSVLKQASSMSARDLTLLELSQFSEARIVTLLGVPPFLLSLPMAQGESLTYANVEQLFAHHERAGLMPMSTHVMTAMSGWLLPSGQSVEQNRDQYSNPDIFSRAQAYALLFAMVDPETGQRALSVPEIRAMERFESVIPGGGGAAAHTGAEVVGNGGAPPPAPAKIIPLSRTVSEGK